MDETDEGSLPAPEASFSELDHAMMRLAMDQALNAQLQYRFFQNSPKE